MKSFSKNADINFPLSVGKNLLLTISAYPLLAITEIILAYVDGRPIPNSSSFLTKLASEYR